MYKILEIMTLTNKQQKTRQDPDLGQNEADPQHWVGSLVKRFGSRSEVLVYTCTVIAIYVGIYVR
jgi:hypothetical protein